MSDYCKKCEKRTTTVYNAFMVAFCAECHTMRGDKSDYTGQKQPFKCIWCGRLLDEDYVGQVTCRDCSPDDQETQAWGDIPF